MILLQQRQSSSVVGTDSIYCKFNYRPEIVDAVRLAADGLGNYHKATAEWEIPLFKLSNLINQLNELDDIKLELKQDQPEAVPQIDVQLKVTPYSYQQQGAQFMISHPNSLLLDVPGLGKTLQIILTAEQLHKTEHIQHCLIICGINTLKQNWKKEINKCSNLDCVVIGEKINSKGKVTYDTVANRAKQLKNVIKEFFVIVNVESIRDKAVIDAIINSKNDFDMVVVDEIHKCASPTSQQSKGLQKIAKKVGRFHYGLTGTLLTSTPMNAYIPLKFIHNYNCTFGVFENSYSIRDIAFGHYVTTGYKNLNQLQQDINDCSLRRTKEALKRAGKELPERTIIPEYLEMDSTHQAFYQSIAEGVVEDADRVEIKTTSLLGLVSRLRQASTCPELLTSKQFINSKIERAVDLVEEIVQSGEKVVIFSVFKQPLYTLESRLSKFNSLVCTGDQEDSLVSDRIDLFQKDPDCPVLLCTISKMSTGVTLTAASYMILIDQPWVPSDREQAIDRIHRIGASKAVTVYCLINQGTIDERVQQLLDMKQAVSDYVIDKKMSDRDELNVLLGLGNPNFLGGK